MVIGQNEVSRGNGNGKGNNVIGNGNDPYSIGI